MTAESADMSAHSRMQEGIGESRAQFRPEGRLSGIRHPNVFRRAFTAGSRIPAGETGLFQAELEIEAPGWVLSFLLFYTYQ